MKCPCCGHVTREKRATVRPAIDLATCTKAALYDHYKRTAPHGDLLHMIKCSGKLPAILARGEALLASAFDAHGELTIPRPEFTRQYVNLGDAWRGAMNAWEREHAGDERRAEVRRRVEGAILCSQVARERSKFLRWELHVRDVPSEAAWLAQCAATVAQWEPQLRARCAEVAATMEREVPF